MFRFFSTWQPLLLILLMVAPLPAAVRAEGYALRVTVRDSEGRALLGINVIVRTEDGQELAQQLTDGAGTASFNELPAVVRVAVSGQPRGGPALFQLDDDATGVRLDLSQAAGPATLDLRVERDGLVLPDPATMLALEPGGPTVEPAAALPTASVATPAPLPTSSAGEPGTDMVRVAGPQEDTSGGRDSWVPLATVLIVAAASVVMLVTRWRGER